MGKERYRRGAHTVTEFKYHFVWKTKYSYRVLTGDLALRLRDIIEAQSDDPGFFKIWDEPMSQKIQSLSRIYPRIQMTSSLNERLRSKQPTGFSR